jgi:hypothetical protein
MLVNSDIKAYNPQFLLPENRAFGLHKNISTNKDVFFRSNQDYIRDNKFRDKDGNYKTPISSGFEYLEAAKLTAIAGLAVAARVAYYFFDSRTFDSMKNIRTLALGSLVIGGVYALATLPKNLYNRKIDICQKKKLMQVYVGNNAASQKLYERIGDEALIADNQRRQDLTGDYMKLRRTKNRVPVFIRNYQ